MLHLMWTWCEQPRMQLRIQESHFLLVYLVQEAQGLREGFVIGPSLLHVKPVIKRLLRLCKRG